ncbi:MAG: hypothetical protein AAFR34_08375, partial [Pseudomonadota bacterium]
MFGGVAQADVVMSSSNNPDVLFQEQIRDVLKVEHEAFRAMSSLHINRPAATARAATRRHRQAFHLARR